MLLKEKESLTVDRKIGCVNSISTNRVNRVIASCIIPGWIFIAIYLSSITSHQLVSLVVRFLVVRPKKLQRGT